jgi:oligopeptide/dipeptide ABC transporter ATP-binding protein
VERTSDLIQVENLVKHFSLRGEGFNLRRLARSPRRPVAPSGSAPAPDRPVIKAVDGVSFTIRVGETLGLVGESGSGKSTTGRLILRLIPATAGRVRFDGQDVFAMPAPELRRMRREMQIVFQDPYGSLNPRMTVGRILGEGLEARGVVSRRERDDEARRLLSLVGLRPTHQDRYPHEFSGGQRQRIGIARALAVNPRFLVADEPVSALDVSIQAQILNLMLDLQRQLGLTSLFIAHDLAVVRHMSDRIAVMYRGKIVELAPSAQIYERPMHPYTRELLAAIPVPDPDYTPPPAPPVPEGPAAAPVGCVFRPRCPYAADVCATDPLLREMSAGHYAACHRAEEIIETVPTPMA